MTPQQPTPELDHLLDHSDWLRSLARAMVADRAAAEDLVQETWLAALRNPPDPRRPARPWLAGVMRNLVRLRARTDARRHRRDERAARDERVSPSSERVERVELEEKLAGLVMELDEPYRTTLVLHYFHEQPAAEIARQQRISAGTVRWRIWRGLGELRGRLERQSEGRRSWMPALLAFAAEDEPAAAPAGSSLLTSALAWKLVGAAALVALVSSVALTASPDGARGMLARVDGVAHLEADRAELDAPARARVATLGAPDELIGAAPTLLLREHDGRPAAGWPVVVVTEEGAEPLALHMSAEGTLPSALLRPGAHLFLGRPDAPVAHLELPGDELPRELTLERGGVFEGHVRVAGRAPAPLELCLTTDGPLLEALAERLGVQELFWSHLDKGRRARTLSGQGGAFRFHGLADGWSGLIVVPTGMRIVGEASGLSDARTEHILGPGVTGEALHFDAAVSGIWIELESRARLRGRVVDPVSGRPVAAALLRLTFRDAEGREHPSDERTDADGSFELALEREEGRAMLLEYWDADGLRGGRRELDAALAAGERSLGDLTLARPRAARFLARDPEGRPVAGAVARADGVREPSAPTDEEGRGELAGLGLGASEVRLRARGFVPAIRPLPERAEDELVFDLERTTRLELLPVDEQGAPLVYVSLRLRASGPLFLGGLDPQHDVLVPRKGRGEQFRVRGGGPDHDFVEMLPDELGRVVLDGLRPGAGLALEVLDRTDRVVQARELNALGAAEWRSESAVVDAPLRALAGCVEIEGGGPLAGAMVRVTGEGGGTAKQRADHDGRFLVPALSSERVRVEVFKPGFEPVVLEEHRIDDSGATLRVTLARASQR